MCKSEEIATVVERTIEEILIKTRDYKKEEKIGKYSPKLRYFLNTQIESVCSKNRLNPNYIRKVINPKHIQLIHN